MTTFYQDIPPISTLQDVTDLRNYYPAPADWLIAITDVRNSTKAIQSGLYKEVNAIAAASITAMLNAHRGIDIPFVFGGDGASFLFPAATLAKAQQALSGARELAKSQFGLDLRVGIIPVADVQGAGYQILVARLQHTDHYQQAVFAGGGLSYADYVLKADDTYWLAEDIPTQADFAGFECRWNPIPSPYDETISLMVQAAGEDPSSVYQAVIETIERIYGDSLRRNPITTQNLNLMALPFGLDVESRIRHRTRSLGRRLKMWRGAMMAWVAMRFNIQGWGGYKADLIANTDSEKFDDLLRMTIAGTTAQRQQLTDFLEQLRQQQQLAYGIHVSKRALITCMVFDYFGQHMHFVDADGGGYALAAQQLKAQTRVMSPIRT